MDMTALDPDLSRFVTEMRAEWAKYPPFDTLTFPQQRDVAEQARSRWTLGGPEMARTQEQLFQSSAGGLGLRLHYPLDSAAPLPALIYIHGGGFTLFSNNTHDRLMREYAARGGFVVIGVDYPLAPEAKYPVALDCIEALMLWLKDNAGQWGIDPDRIAMGGDSAGGNLAFATFMRLRDRDEQGIVKAILSNYGGFSSRISDESEARFGGPGSIMDRAESQQYWENYLRDERDADDPYACPIHADLQGFPPVLLIIPDQDIVAEHSFTMDERLRAAGVDVQCNVYQGAIHSFLEAMSISGLASDAIDKGADFIATALGGNSIPTKPR